MQADFLDVAKHEKGVFDFAFLDYFLKVLVFDQELVDCLLDVGQRHPHNKISFKWQFVKF